MISSQLQFTLHLAAGSWQYSVKCAMQVQLVLGSHNACAFVNISIPSLIESQATERTCEKSIVTMSAFMTV